MEEIPKYTKAQLKKLSKKVEEVQSSKEKVAKAKNEQLKLKLD